ncbi:MAG: hypothetical protein J6M38_11835, partial [Lentisphaeria bacterium]|nr:hypothetical protein [Lentisphaeria bacterium]
MLKAPEPNNFSCIHRPEPNVMPDLPLPFCLRSAGGQGGKGRRKREHSPVLFFFKSCGRRGYNGTCNAWIHQTERKQSN